MTFAHLPPFSYPPAGKNDFLNPQFIQLRIYSGAKSTIWCSLSLFFSPWSKSNHSKWLLMVIIATASYWSSESAEWKQTKQRRNGGDGGSLWAIIFGLFICPLWGRDRKMYERRSGFGFYQLLLNEMSSLMPHFLCLLLPSCKLKDKGRSWRRGTLIQLAGKIIK